MTRKLVLVNIELIEGGLWKKLIGKQRRAFIMYDYSKAYNPKMPMTIEQYDSASQMLPLKSSDYLEGPVWRLGFSDNLGRHHWIS